MRKGITGLVAIIISILILTSGFAAWLFQTRPNLLNVPGEYRETFLALEETLKDFDGYLSSNWNGQKHNVFFGANLIPANLHLGADMLKEEYYNKTISYLDALESLGVKEIHIDMGYPLLSPDYPNSQKYLEFYRKIANEVKSRGLKLHIEFAFAIPGYYYPVSYEGFTKEKVKEVMLYYASLICKELKPDYYTIVDEPTTQNQRFNLILSVEDWTEIVSFVKNNLNCSNVLIGAGGGTWEEELIKSFASKTKIDFVNIHLYGVHRNDLYKVIEIAEFARLKGKKVGIGETWLHSGGQNSLKDKWRYSDVFSFWEPLDAEFMKILVKLAHYQKLEFVDPFFTNYFFAYLDYNEVIKNKEVYMPPQKGLKIALEIAMKNAAEGKFTQTGLAYRNAIGEFPEIKVAILYGTIIDQTRSIEEINKIIKDLNVDLIFRGFFRWKGMAKVEYKYDVYGALKEYISKIKRENPNLIFVGALAAQELSRIEYNPYTKEVIPEDKVWNMALNPQKYGFNLSEEELHEKYWEITGDENYIFPDILNPDYQNLLLDLAKAQIDAGVDAIWIDGFFWQAKTFAKLVKTTSHPQIEKVFRATNKIVDEIHNYGLSRGKYVYVGSWAQTGFPYKAPKLDFVTISPSAEEIREKKLNEIKWIDSIKQIKEKYGNVPIIAFIDWAFTADTPLGVFSQELTPEEQREVLRSFDEFFSENGIIFAYPVHGGYMGRDATKLSFGKSGKYDALAPEFQTYETIKKLARDRSLNIFSCGHAVACPFRAAAP